MNSEMETMHGNYENRSEGLENTTAMVCGTLFKQVPRYSDTTGIKELNLLFALANTCGHSMYVEATRREQYWRYSRKFHFFKDMK
jgi:hypothetical protein